MCHGNKELTAEFTRFDQAYYAYSGRLLKCSSSSSSLRGSKFSISLASIPNGENMRFRPAIFIRLIIILDPFCSFIIQQLRTCNNHAKITFIHPVIHHCMPKLDFFLYSLYVGRFGLPHVGAK